MMEKLFFLKSRHGDYCSSVSFWNKGGNGYGTDLNNLELFTLEQAQRHLEQDHRALPLLASEVMKHAKLRVDMQRLDDDKGKPVNLDDLCVIQLKGQFDGNDVPFYHPLGYLYDYCKATVCTYEQALLLVKKQEHIWLKSYVDTIARPTFQSVNINLKTMVTVAGIKYKKPRPPRPTTGKTRGNCLTCGKITWDYNPYEIAYCRDHDAEWKRR